MSSSFIDISGYAKAYAYVQPKEMPVSEAETIAKVEETETKTETGNATEAEKWTSIHLSAPDVENVTKIAENATAFLDKVISLLEKIMGIVELYLNTFSSFTKAVSSLIEMAQQILLNMTENLGKAGVYANLIAPPAFYNLSDLKVSKMASGGFNGFLSRLADSLNNDKDKNRPILGPDATVGGAVFLVDSESLDEVFAGLKQLAQVFDFMEAFGLGLEPPPPRNIKARPGYFTVTEDGKTVNKFGVALEWDPPPLPVLKYVVSRSTRPGGEVKVVEYVPTKLMGKDGLIPTALAALSSGVMIWPTKTVHVYADKTFNDGKPVEVVVNKANGGAAWRDFFIEYDKTPNGYGKPNDKTIFDLFYVVQSKSLLGVGPMSYEVKVHLKFCDDSQEVAQIIQHNTGVFEFLGGGFGGLSGNWTSIQIQALAPFLIQTVSFINDFLKTIKGLFNDASDSFSEFMKQIKERVTYWVGLIKIISRLIKELERFIIGPSVSFLWLPERPGGVENFVRRVKAAQVPPDRPFSGPSGVSVGLVFMYGYSTSGLDEESKKALKAQFEAASKAFSAIKNLFKSG